MYSMWKYHNQAIREHPEYQMEGMMDCFREEMSYYMPYPKEVSEYPERVTEPAWTKKQWYIIQQLKADNEDLRTKWYEHLKEDREYRANASKRKPKSTKY